MNVRKMIELLEEAEKEGYIQVAMEITPDLNTLLLVYDRDYDYYTQIMSRYDIDYEIEE